MHNCTTQRIINENLHSTVPKDSSCFPIYSYSTRYKHTHTHTHTQSSKLAVFKSRSSRVVEHKPKDVVEDKNIALHLLQVK